MTLTSLSFYLLVLALLAFQKNFGCSRFPSPSARRH